MSKTHASARWKSGSQPKASAVGERSEFSRINSLNKISGFSPGAKTDGQPLRGWRILTTRASKQSGGLARPLRELGAEVIEIPTIEIRPPRSYKRLDDALRAIASYDWLILTSVNGVDPLF